MITRRFALAAAAALAALGPFAARADAPLAVVASFSILGDMVARVGGERIATTVLVGPDGDAHVYQPTPADARAVAGADLVFVNGLGFEGWIDRLIAASGYKGPVVAAAAGVKLLEIEEEHGHGHSHGHAHGHDHGEVDPHAWQSLPNAAIYVKTIANALAEADPQGTPVYFANRDAYLAQITALEAEVAAAVAALPPERRVVVTSHDAFGYFERDHGLRFLAPQGVSTEAEASAADVAKLIEQIRAELIPAVFVETIADPRLLEQIRRETGAAIGGALYSDALSGPDGPAPSYLDLIRHNIATLAAALSS
jgi:zinc/manganese transport system substrate-binding protein